LDLGERLSLCRFFVLVETIGTCLGGGRWVCLSWVLSVLRLYRVRLFLRGQPGRTWRTRGVAYGV
jgi:hypothetical protein